VEVIGQAFRTEKFEGTPSANRPRRGDELVRAIEMANRAVFAKASSDPELAGMGTTVVAFRFSPNKQRVYVAHVGDSRAYRIRGEDLTQLTGDHTIGALTGATGKIAAQLTRAVGIGNEVEVDLSVDEPKPGDLYILCSDGLTKMVPDEMIWQVASSDHDLAKAAQKLVEKANERGGRDNVTVILVRVDAPPRGNERTTRPPPPAALRRANFTTAQFDASTRRSIFGSSPMAWKASGPEKLNCGSRLTWMPLSFSPLAARIAASCFDVHVGIGVAPGLSTRCFTPHLSL
jgi:serine/threonine protein phosphatase PrpC